MKKRIMYIIDNITFGGGERGFAQLVTKLNHAEFEPVVVACLEGPFAKLIQQADVELIGFDFSKLVNPAAFLELRKIIKVVKPDIVHSQGTRADFYARIAAYFAGKPIYVSTVQMLIEGYNVNVFKKFIYVQLSRVTERWVDHFVVVSEALKKFLIYKHRVNPGKVSVIPNGIELEHYNSVIGGEDGHAFRSKLGLNDGAFVYGAIGRLVWQKGLFHLVRAAKIVKDFAPRSVCVIVGDGPLRKELEKTVKTIGVAENVVFAGFMEDIRPALFVFDVLVLPSLTEGHPMIILEAMAMGRPVIASDIHGVQNQVIHNETGFLVPSGDETQLAKAIQEVVIDHEKSRQMGRAGRKRVENMFDVNNTVKAHEDLYKGLLAHT